MRQLSRHRRPVRPLLRFLRARAVARPAAANLVAAVAARRAGAVGSRIDRRHLVGTNAPAEIAASVALAAGLIPAATLSLRLLASFGKTFRKCKQREGERPVAERPAMRGKRQVPPDNSALELLAWPWPPDGSSPAVSPSPS